MLQFPPDFCEFLRLLNAHHVESLLKGVNPALFLRERLILRMGLPPTRLEVTTYIDGVTFAECYGRRVSADVQGVPVSLIGLGDLRVDKRAAGRLKDLADLEQLPEV